MYFCHIENFAYGEINERSFSNPHPCSRQGYLKPELAKEKEFLLYTQFDDICVTA